MWRLRSSKQLVSTSNSRSLTLRQTASKSQKISQWRLSRGSAIFARSCLLKLWGDRTSPTPVRTSLTRTCQELKLESLLSASRPSFKLLRLRTKWSKWLQLWTKCCTRKSRWGPSGKLTYKGWLLRWTKDSTQIFWKKRELEKAAKSNWSLCWNKQLRAICSSTKTSCEASFIYF